MRETLDALVRACRQAADRYQREHDTRAVVRRHPDEETPLVASPELAQANALRQAAGLIAELAPGVGHPGNLRGIVARIGSTVLGSLPVRSIQGAAVSLERVVRLSRDFYRVLDGEAPETFEPTPDVLGQAQPGDVVFVRVARRDPPRQALELLAEVCAMTERTGVKFVVLDEGVELARIIGGRALERMARAHDAEEAAQKGEPSPWRDDLGGSDKAWKAERVAAMRAAVEDLLTSG